MKALPQNVTAFRIGGWAMHNLDQKMLRCLKKIADRKGRTLEEAMTDAVRSFLAECELEEKIIRFPVNAHLRIPPPQR
jgi:hypothetical protein